MSSKLPQRFVDDLRDAILAEVANRPIGVNCSPGSRRWRVATVIAQFTTGLEHLIADSAGTIAKLDMAVDAIEAHAREGKG
jgi:hypothetical protein